MKQSTRLFVIVTIAVVLVVGVLFFIRRKPRCSKDGYLFLSGAIRGASNDSCCYRTYPHVSTCGCNTCGCSRKNSMYMSEHESSTHTHFAEAGIEGPDMYANDGDAYYPVY